MAYKPVSEFKPARVAYNTALGAHVNDAAQQAKREGFDYVVHNDHIYTTGDIPTMIGAIRERFLRHPEDATDTEYKLL